MHGEYSAVNGEPSSEVDHVSWWFCSRADSSGHLRGKNIVLCDSGMLVHNTVQTRLDTLHLTLHTLDFTFHSLHFLQSTHSIHFILYTPHFTWLYFLWSFLCSAFGFVGVSCFFRPLTVAVTGRLWAQSFRPEHLLGSAGPAAMTHGIHMGLSINGDTPEWMVYFMGNPSKNGWGLGYPILGKPHICTC